MQQLEGDAKRLLDLDLVKARWRRYQLEVEMTQLRQDLADLLHEPRTASVEAKAADIKERFRPVERAWSEAARQVADIAHRVGVRP